MSDLRDILVTDETVSGTVLYRSLGIDGEDKSKEPKRVGFQAIRDMNNEAEHQKLVEQLNASGVTWDNARPSRLSGPLARTPDDWHLGGSGSRDASPDRWHDHPCLSREVEESYTDKRILQSVLMMRQVSMKQSKRLRGRRLLEE